MEELEFKKALNELRAIWVDGNNYISVTEPWTVIKTDPERAAAILRVLPEFDSHLCNFVLSDYAGNCRENAGKIWAENRGYAGTE